MPKRITKAERLLRQDVIDTCLEMNSLRINQGTSGNVSARWKDGLLVTPSGIPYKELLPEDIIFMEFDGSFEAKEGLKPSSEWRFHVDIMRERSDVGAIVHTHSMYATTIAIKGLDIPAVHYMIAAAGGPTIRCAPYATFGTAELSEYAVEALEGRHACILRHHGVIACGKNLSRALWLAGEVETLAKQFHLSMLLGKPSILPDDEIERVVAKFGTYGPQQRPK
jgi:L-fuculose-phosphate aldolase